MLLIPAIDIRNGRCVRLYQGKFDKETVYNADPVSVALDFENRGAKRLHVVDLDGAAGYLKNNLSIIRKICENTQIPVECGGGVGDLKTAEAFISSGVSEVILGTIVIKKPDNARELIKNIGIDKIQIGLDYSGEKIAVSGWKELIKGSVCDEIEKWGNEGVQRFILTDITRDGTMLGPGFSLLRKIAGKVNVKITAAEGVSGPEDITKLSELETLGVDRVISGKAVYEGKIRIEDYA